MSVLRSLTARAVPNARAAASDITQAIGDRALLADRPARLTTDKCLSLLAGSEVGRLAYLAREATPDIVPVNYVMDGKDVLIRSGPSPKLQAAERKERVALEVDELHDGAGWSVVLVGTAQRLRGADLARVLRSGIPLPQPWAGGPRHELIRISVHRVEGRRLPG